MNVPACSHGLVQDPILSGAARSLSVAARLFSGHALAWYKACARTNPSSGMKCCALAQMALRARTRSTFPSLQEIMRTHGKGMRTHDEHLFPAQEKHFLSQIQWG
ncbi:unnamed protein product [Rhodiola kirilowii]